MDELIIDGQVYVPSRRAAEITGYAKDYIGQLCREGRVEAKLVGRSWYVLETSLREHRFGSEDSVVVPEAAGNAPLDLVKESQATDTWESPSYTAEEVPEIVPLNRPNYLENTQDNIEETIQETSVPSVESAWEDWYAKSGRPEASVAEAAEPHEESQIELAPESAEEWAVPQETRIPVRNIPGSMDIAPTHYESPFIQEVPQAIIYERKRAKKPQRRRGWGPRIHKALFVAYVILVGAVVAIGVGFLDSGLQNPVIDFIAGIQRLTIR